MAVVPGSVVRGLAAGIVLVLAAACSTVPTAGACVGQRPECVQAVKIARQFSLPEAGIEPERVLAVAVEEWRECEVIERYGAPGGSDRKLRCPDDLHYAAKVAFTIHGLPDPVVVRVVQWRGYAMYAPLTEPCIIEPCP